jgi:toxin YoeB
MKIVWTQAAWDDYLYWQKYDQKTFAASNELIRDIERSPFKGLGKPEPLRRGLSGWWSRRITAEHRLVYRGSGTDEAQRLEIAQCRYHY